MGSAGGHTSRPFTRSPIGAILHQPRAFWHVLCEIGSIITGNRRLIFEMARREITDRFAGSYLGVVWSIAHPMILMLTYVFVFAMIFRGSVPSHDSGYNVFDFNFTVQMISAYLAWMVFTDVFVKSCNSVTGKANLAKQVVFPLEILPIKGVLASLLPQCIALLFLFSYTLIKFHTLPVTWVFVPFLLFCEIIFLCGVAFIMSSIGVFIRDLREIASIIALIGFYGTPILYSEHALSDKVQSWLPHILRCNPVSYMVWPFRDACFHGQFVHPAAWVAMPIASLCILVIGYRVFRKLKPQFGNAL